MGYFADLAKSGVASMPSPRGVAKMRHYWEDPDDEIDTPLPQGRELIRKKNPTGSKQRRLEIPPSGSLPESKGIRIHRPY